MQLLTQPKKTFTEGVSSPISPTVPISTPSDLNVLEIVPKEDISVLRDFSQPIEIAFNENTSPQNFFYKTAPATKLIIKQGKDAKSIFIYPELKWEDGINQITILSGTRSLTGATLKNPIMYKIKTGLPTQEIYPPGVDY